MLSGVLEFVVKNILAPALAVNATDWVVLKVPPEVPALTVGASAWAVAAVFEPPPPPPPPHPKMNSAAVASPVSFNNFIASTFIEWLSDGAMLLDVLNQILRKWKVRESRIMTENVRVQGPERLYL